MTNAIWLADTLRNAGLNVVEQPSWKTRGRAEMGDVKGILLHHTAGALTGEAPSLALVENGRPDLAGPLSHLVLGRSGTFYVVAAGRCNHAGVGSWQSVSSGNSNFIGIEAENAGTGKDPWPDVQMDAYARGVAAILKHIGVPAIMAAGHKEYALPKGRKIDPSFDCNAFRERVTLIMAGSSAVNPVANSDPVQAMLKRGDSGGSVLALQHKLGIREDGDFGPATETAVKAFQSSHGLVADGLVGPKTWAALG